MKLVIVFSFIEYVLSSDVKIVGGRQAREKEFKWAVSVQKEPMKHSCVGSVLTSSCVLTSCSLMQPEGNSAARYVMAGSTTLKKSKSWTGQERVSSKITLHPECKAKLSGAWVFDFAIITLQKPFELNTHLQPIAFPKDLNMVAVSLEEKMKQGAMCTVVGWGFTVYVARYEKGDVPSDDLKALDVQLVSYAECSRLFNESDDNQLEIAKRSQACARAVTDQTIGICGGDLGGPLLCRNEIYAIASLAPECGSKRRPSIYSSIAPVIEWFIKEVPSFQKPASLSSRGLHQSVSIILILIVISVFI